MSRLQELLGLCLKKSHVFKKLNWSWKILEVSFAHLNCSSLFSCVGLFHVCFGSLFCKRVEIFGVHTNFCHVVGLYYNVFFHSRRSLSYVCFGGLFRKRIERFLGPTNSGHVVRLYCTFLSIYVGLFFFGGHFWPKVGTFWLRTNFGYIVRLYCTFLFIYVGLFHMSLLEDTFDKTLVHFGYVPLFATFWVSFITSPFIWIGLFDVSVICLFWRALLKNFGRPQKIVCWFFKRKMMFFKRKMIFWGLPKLSLYGYIHIYMLSSSLCDNFEIVYISIFEIVTIVTQFRNCHTNCHTPSHSAYIYVYTHVETISVGPKKIIFLLKKISFLLKNVLGPTEIVFRSAV